MIEIEILATGSKGNSYIVSDGKSSLLLDAGISWKQIMILSGWRRFDSVFITHQHKDHCKAVDQLLNHGNVYMPMQMKQELALHHHNAIGIHDKSKIVMKDWTIVAFGLHHDVETLGYLIWSARTNKKICYITDTMYCKYKFTGITHWMIEANNVQEVMDENLASGKLAPGLRTRVMHNHMSLETVKGLLQANDLSKTEVIYLLHLSDSNSDEERIKREVEELTGKLVIIA